TDGATLTLIAPAPEASVARRVDTPAGPRTVSVWEREGALWLAVPCQDAARLLLVEVDGEGRHELALPAASRPFGAVSLGDALYVSLQATGELAEVRFEGGAPRVARRLPALPDARGVARTPDGRLAVTRWRSPDDAAEIALVDVATGAVERTSLAFDPQPSNDSESGGLPSYLEQVLFSPTGREAAVPSLQANIGEGTWRSERPLSFETSVRGVVSFLGADLEEDFEARKQFDNRGFAAAGVWSSRGDYLFLATRGHRSVERLDAFTRSNAGTILGTGFAPDGLALSPDDRWLYVNASLSRRVEVYDVSSFVDLPRPVAMVPLVDAEPLAPNVLLGKQLFNDSFDPRMARDGYIACAHCHLDGDSDHRVWDFTDRGEGLRRTPPLLGRGDDGLFHWSGNFDELQDFENDIRLHFEGTGLLSGGDWAESRDTFGPAKAGRSEELDALAAYMESLTHLPSPHREADGGLPPAAERGRAVFEGAGCGDCHAGANLTDSGLDGDGAPVLHDVGTLSEASGGRLGGALEGLDTPTLHGAWHQGRWLHDGGAETLGEAVRAHEGVVLEDGALADLVAYLRCLDGRVD
ncbi:MAG TPA: hypothetical protein RMH80_33275, partial [Polyangiaceae bacterium LLY-WYZ-15_(1-7)]|nr:hypothetical protein [Polyangiaceae bacterium LLY-WYZ-15_(1-7)]